VPANVAVAVANVAVAAIGMHFTADAHAGRQCVAEHRHMRVRVCA